MRTLKAKDLGPFTKILSKIEIKDVIQNLFLNNEPTKIDETPEDSKRRTENRGRRILAEIAGAVIENYYKAEKDFIQFLSSVSEKPVNEIEEMPVGEFISLIMELFSADNLPFFKTAVK